MDGRRGERRPPTSVHVTAGADRYVRGGLPGPVEAFSGQAHDRALNLPAVKISSVAAALAGAAFLVPVAPAVAHAGIAPAPSVAARHACTHTSSGSCIRGGQFCSQSLWKKAGWDARGVRYVCKGNRTHPHWS